MFTIKFFRNDKAGYSRTFISCVNYSILKRKNGSSTITTYPSMLDNDGVDREIIHANDVQTSDTLYFDECYIENEKGKIIDYIGVEPPEGQEYCTKTE